MAWVRVCKAEIYGVDVAHARANPKSSCLHAFSCEISPVKRKFLRKNFDMQLLFLDVTTLGHHKSFDELSGELQEVPHVHGVVGGTSCKDFSSMKSCGKAGLLESAEGTSTVAGSCKSGWLFGLHWCIPTSSGNIMLPLRVLPVH